MNDTCICDNAPKVWRLTGVTRTLRLRIFNPDGTPLDLTGRTVAVTIARDNSEFVYAPGFVIEGDDNNVVKFEWPADQQGAGDYTINVTTTDGSGNADRVNWHGPTGIRLVDFSFMVRGEDALGVTSEANIGLDGTFTMNGAGMSAYDEWLVEGHTGTPEDFIAWLRQPAEDAATEAEATVDAKMAEVDETMDEVQEQADADHARAEGDHTTAAGDHTRAEADHVQAVTDSQQAATDHHRAEIDAAAAASDREKAATDRTKAANDRQQAAVDHGTAAQDHATASSDHQQAQSDHSTASADHTKATQDAERAASDHTRAGDDHDTAVADHHSAETDHTRAEQDHTTAAADHTTAAADHTQATADHEVMAGYDTRLGNVEGEVSQLGQEMVTKRTGRNLFDYSGAELNKRLTASGGLANDTNYLVTDYIPVVAGENYYISDVANSLGTSQYICFFSSQKAFVSSEHYTNSTYTLVTIPTGCTYMRCTINVAALTKLQIERGNKRGNYLPYTEIGGYVPDVDVSFVYDSVIADNAIGNAKILDKSVSAEKVSFIKSINLLNKNDANVALSKYIKPADGLLANNTGYNTTGYIRVESGKTYYFGSTDAQNNAIFYCLFDRYFGYVSGGSSVSSVTIPDGVFFIRFSISTSAWGGKKAQMTADSLKPYSEYELRLDVPTETFKPCINALGQSGFSKTFASTLSSGDLFQLEDYPYFQLKGIVMSFSCEITSFSSLIVGKGYQKRLGEYIQIDGTNVQLITCDLSGNETIRDTSAHGLTISDFLRVSLVYMGDGQVQYVISTKSGMFNKTLSWRYIGEYEPFVKSIGTTATEVKLSIGSTDLKKSVWAFGDSYMSISSERWPGVLNTMGLLNIMVNALSGINSTNMIVDAQRAFAFGAPLFAIWGLGMNDASDADSSTPASTWVTAIETFIALCKANDTEPILATIPCIPSKNHEGKNAWVRSSGYRYIDFAKAVNGQTYTSGSSNWYDAMLSTDNVHPTTLGAQALASQLLQDLPEIMQITP